MAEVMGALLAFLAAFSWGLAPIIYRPSIKDLDGLEVNSVKNYFAAIFGLPLALLMDSNSLNVPLELIITITLATLLNVILGDIFYISALKYGGASIGVPVSYTFPIFTAIFSFAFFHEKLLTTTIIGAFFVVTGIAIVSYFNKDTKNIPLGIAFGLISAAIWGLGLSLYGDALRSVSPFSLIAYRSIIFMIVFPPMTYPTLKRKKVYLRDFVKLNVGGVFGILLGSILFYFSVQLLESTSKATVISSTAPMISFILAVLILKEFKETKLSLASVGIILTILGSILAVWR